MSSSESAERFWETTRLDDMSDEQWESLCDGCGRCCLQKLEDIDSGKIYFTSVSCRLLDLETCRCGDYKRRKTLVPDCTLIRPMTDEKRSWLPKTCAYRRLSEGKPLLDWHPLVSGNTDSVKQAGISVAHFATSENEVRTERYEEFIIEFDES